MYYIWIYLSSFLPLIQNFYIYSLLIFSQSHTTLNTVRIRFTEVLINLGVYSDDNNGDYRYLTYNYPFYVFMLMCAMEITFIKFLEEYRKLRD